MDVQTLYEVEKITHVASAKSDRSGFYILKNLVPGKYQIQFWPKGYENKYVSVTLKKGPNITDHNVEFTAVPPLWFSLKDQYGKPMQARITYRVDLVGFGSSIRAGPYPVEGNGRFLISVLRPGKYMIGLQAPGYAPCNKEITIPEEGYPKDTLLPVVMKKLE